MKYVCCAFGTQAIEYYINRSYNFLINGVANLKRLWGCQPTQIQLEDFCRERKCKILFDLFVAEIFSSDSVRDISASCSSVGDDFLRGESFFLVSPASAILQASFTWRLNVSALSAYTWCPAPVITCKFVSQALKIPICIF
jgi:hypothetical protein